MKPQIGPLCEICFNMERKLNVSENVNMLLNKELLCQAVLLTMVQYFCVHES